tara:strand:+ start:1051 stop:3483 length:2433 start_codon:yes stop_codon:yes gene_type:complete
MLDETTMQILETMKRTGDKIDPELLRDADPDQLNHLNSISMEAPDAQQVDDPSKLELFGEGLIDSYPELGRGAVQLGTHLADTLLPDSYSPSPETIREADRKAGYFRNPNENPYFKAGEQPDKKLFQLTYPFSDRELFSGFNPYETGKVAGQMSIPLGKFMPKGGLGTLKNRLKFGTGLGAGYGALLPNEGGEDYWKDKGWQMGVGAVGGPIIGEIAFRILQAGVAGAEGIQRLGNKTIDFVKSFAERIRQGEQLPESLAQLPDDALRGVPVQIQERLQQILDEAKTQGGVLTPEQALRVATQESIGYPSGTQGAEMFPHRPLTPAQLTQDPAIAAEELMLEGNPAYKQILRDQDKYMTGAVDKISEKLQTPTGRTPAYTGEAGYPEITSTGREVAGVADAMSERLRAKTGRIYSQATKEYGKARVKPINYMKTVEEIKDDATASEVTDKVAGMTGKIRRTMINQRPKPYKGQKGTMKADMWSSSAGKPPPPTVQPKADSLSVASYEGIRKTITNHVAQLRKSGNLEGAKVMRKLRDAMDRDVELAVGHDVYKVGRGVHEAGMKGHLDHPVVTKVLTGGYDDKFEQVVADVEKLPYEQLLKLKSGMYSEGARGKEAWRRLAAQIWHEMKEKAIKGYEGHGPQGRMVGVPTLESKIKQFSKTASGLGANTPKGKLLFGEEIANEITNILKASRDLQIMGKREVRTGWGGIVNLLDWGSKLLGKVPSLQTRGASNVLSQATQAVKRKEQDNIAGEVLERTMKDPRQFRPREGKATGVVKALGRIYKPNPLFYSEATGIQEIDKRRKRGVLSP